MELTPPDFEGTKTEVRQAVRALPDGMRKWMALQGRVYGARMEDAELIDGVSDFILRGRGCGADICIVSHKTEYGHFDPERINLREASLAWMDARGFFDGNGIGLSRDHVHFETTRDEKISRISSLGCTHFIDDLEEVFREPAFPESVTGYLLAAGNEPLPSGPFRAFHQWQDISDDILGDHR
jgi:hypothetical protein